MSRIDEMHAENVFERKNVRKNAVLIALLMKSSDDTPLRLQNMFVITIN